jgi:hypothetical protein
MYVNVMLLGEVQLVPFQSAMVFLPTTLRMFVRGVELVFFPTFVVTVLLDGVDLDVIRRFAMD